jgi:protein-L-isoaspartate(D-aspartate) O-methyltransferase
MGDQPCQPVPAPHAGTPVDSVLPANSVPHFRSRPLLLLAACVLVLSLLLHFRTFVPARRPLPADEHAAVQPASSPASTQATTATAPATRAVPPALSWSRPRTAARQAEREAMVARQIASGDLYRDPVRDARVLAAMRAVPRHEFVTADRQAGAYADGPLPIGCGQTISQPYIVALMTELLQLQEGERVLEIGTGSGYQAAVLAELTPHVYTIEIIAPLCQQATERLARLGYATVQVRRADGYDGWPDAGPFDGIIVTCAAGHVPPPLWEQLKPGGRMVIPIGGVYETQRLVVLSKQADGGRRSRSVVPVQFVPMTGKLRDQ